MDDHLELNKKSWNARLEAHLTSDLYDMDSFLKGKSTLNPIELELLGNIKGKRILHLQCHFGQDTISLCKFGAECVGVDLSDKAITKAQELATLLDANAEFICSDIYQLSDVLKGQFDIVYTSYGVISWLPDLARWSEVITYFLKPDGKFVFVEFHPLVWIFDDELENIVHHYQNVEAIVEEEEGTYADRDAAIKQKCVCWNHGIGEVTNNLISQGLTIDALSEYSYSPYPFVKGMEEFEPQKFRIKRFENKIPLVYSISATLKK